MRVLFSLRNYIVIASSFIVLVFAWIVYRSVDYLIKINFVIESGNHIKKFMFNFQDYGATILTLFSIVVATLIIAIQHSFSFISKIRKKLLFKYKNIFLIDPSVMIISMFIGFLFNIVILTFIIYFAYDSFYLNDEILKLKVLFYLVIYSIFLIFSILVLNTFVCFISD